MEQVKMGELRWRGLEMYISIISILFVENRGQQTLLDVNKKKYIIH
jgi:hypothetical protein